VTALTLTTLMPCPSAGPKRVLDLHKKVWSEPKVLGHGSKTAPIKKQVNVVKYHFLVQSNKFGLFQDHFGPIEEPGII